MGRFFLKILLRWPHSHSIHYFFSYLFKTLAFCLKLPDSSVFIPDSSLSISQSLLGVNNLLFHFSISLLKAPYVIRFVINLLLELCNQMLVLGRFFSICTLKHSEGLPKLLYSSISRHSTYHRKCKSSLFLLH